MKFQPSTNRYRFAGSPLIKHFPEFVQEPIASWLLGVLKRARVAIDFTDSYGGSDTCIQEAFRHQLQLEFREPFPNIWDEFIIFVFNDADRTANLLALCLQNFAYRVNADALEAILSKSGLGYEVINTNKNNDIYFQGGFNLIDKVNPLVKKLSTETLEHNELLNEAWNYCYSINPDYEKSVSRSCDFLEGYLGNLYFPQDPKPQLKKFVHSFESNPSQLKYKGDSIVDPKNTLTSLLKQASNRRGQHIMGKGRIPTKGEAEFILHTVVLIWNLHQTGK